MIERTVEWSLFLRSLYNIMELLDRIYLEQDSTGYKLSQDEVDKAWEGIKRFNDVMKFLATKDNNKESPKYRIPYIIKIEGHA